MKTWKNNLQNASSIDEVAFKEIFKLYYADLCVYAKRFIQDQATREDIVQDVFCAIWVNRGKIDFSIPLTNYLITSVKRHCLNFLRKNKRIQYDESAIENIPVYAEDNENLFMMQEMKDLFNKILASLPEEYRIAFEMSRVEDKPTCEIAQTLGVSVRTVERYRKKALEILQTQLKDYMP